MSVGRSEEPLKPPWRNLENRVLHGWKPDYPVYMSPPPADCQYTQPTYWMTCLSSCDIFTICHHLSGLCNRSMAAETPYSRLTRRRLTRG